jgi:hypothetical protein
MTLVEIARLALCGFVGGSIFVVSVIFIGLTLNLRGMRTAHAGIPLGARFYGMWALTGGGLGVMFAITIPLLEAAKIKDPWYGLIMMGLMFVILIPMWLFLRRERRRSGASV